MKKAAQRKDFKPVALNATLDAAYAVKAETITSYNVLGRLAGAKHPNETVIYSGHWDHLGIGQPDAKGDRIYNGARDNASCIAALLELGRAFAKAPRTNRSVLFLAVTAEEKGLLGSEYYAANPVYPLATTAGVINMDSIVGEGAAKDSARFAMARAGVPAFSCRGGIARVKGGVARGKELGAIYTRDRYHQPADEWSADMDLSNIGPDLTLLYNTGRALADGRAWPDWAPDAEFKAKRDETAAERK